MVQAQKSFKKLLRPLPLRDQVYDALRRELFQGTFTPGQRITEQEIAEALGVSRTPVREALNQFRNQGILSQSHGGGYIFTAPTAKQLEDIFEMRRVLEPLAARKAVNNCTAADIEKLAELVEKEESLIDEKDSSRNYLYNSEFRNTFFHLCDNERLAANIDEYTGHILFHGIHTLKKKHIRRIVIQGHRNIVEALRRGDEEEMERTIHEFLDQSYEALMEVIRVCQGARPDCAFPGGAGVITPRHSSHGTHD